MGNWYKQFEALIWAFSIAAALIVFSYQSFATKEYVELRHDSVMDVLRRIDDSVKKIDDRTYKLMEDRRGR